MKKRILVWPANTEIGLEIGHAFKGQTHFEVIGISSGPGPADFVFDTHIHDAPNVNSGFSADFIHDNPHRVDLFYLAHDRAFFDARFSTIPVIGYTGLTSYTTLNEKRLTYEVLSGIIETPVCLPKGKAFRKPNIGSGSVGAKKMGKEWEVICEYLPGAEFTIDCLTDRHGVLRYCQPRTRARIKSGITVETEFSDRPDLVTIGEKINAAMSMRGAWFFQVKERADGTPVLLEVGCRPAGSSGINRAIGINLPLLAAYDACGLDIDVMPGKYTVSACRSLTTHFTTDLKFDTVYCDWDDTVTQNGKLNPKMCALLLQFKNDGKTVTFITRSKGDQPEFAQIIWAAWVRITTEKKQRYMVTDRPCIFIDDSHAERKEVHEATGIPVFSPQQAIDLWLK